MSNDTSIEIRRGICEAFVSLTEVRADYIQRHILNIVQFMLHASNDPDEDIAFDACQFWSVLGDASYCKEAVQPFLPKFDKTSFPFAFFQLIDLWNN